MGFTIHWMQNKDFTDQQWDVIQELTRKVVVVGIRNGVVLAYDPEDEDMSTDERISFNGVKSKDGETFRLRKIRDPRRLGRYEPGAVYEFCKTQYLPYTKAVVTMLRNVLLIAPGAITDIHNDGPESEQMLNNPEHYWELL